MPEKALGMQEYLDSYVPGLVGRFLAEKPIPNMEDTDFTLQVTIEGEKSFTFGIAIRDARGVTVFPCGLENSMLSLSLPEDILRHVTL